MAVIAVRIVAIRGNSMDGANPIAQARIPVSTTTETVRPSDSVTA